MIDVKLLSLPPLPAESERHLALLADRLLQGLRQGLEQRDWGGLRPSHFRLMGCVPRDGATITELAAPLFMTKQAVGQFVAQLCETGHLNLLVDPQDRRRRVVVRTDLGDRVVAEVTAVIGAVEQHWIEQAGSEDYAVFRRVLERLVGG